jgi:archaellum component FlaG (FlaF/FlaG flagellin family)
MFDMMLLIMVASHILIATMVAVIVAALSSGKVRDLEDALQKERASRAEMVRRHNEIIASYGLAEPLAGTGDEDGASALSTGSQLRGKAPDVRDVAAGVLG